MIHGSAVESSGGLSRFVLLLIFLQELLRLYAPKEAWSILLVQEVQGFGWKTKQRKVSCLRTNNGTNYIMNELEEFLLWTWYL